MNWGEVNLFLAFEGCGSGKVIQISSTSSGENRYSICSILVRIKATFDS